MKWQDPHIIKDARHTSGIVGRALRSRDSRPPQPRPLECTRLMRVVMADVETASLLMSQVCLLETPEKFKRKRIDSGGFMCSIACIMVFRQSTDEGEE